MIDYLSAISLLIGYILTGKRNRIGWIFSLLGNLGYIYILSSSEYKGLFILSVLMAIICVYNFVKWSINKLDYV